MNFKTADLCDEHGDRVLVVAPLFRKYGGGAAFCGEITTVRVFEDNVLVREALSQAGHGKVLVIDGGGSLRCALVGDQLAALAYQNGWSGIVVNGCIRDAEAIAEIGLGLRALATNPRKSVKRGLGDRDLTVTFGGVNFVPGHYLYADNDGMVVSEFSLLG